MITRACWVLELWKGNCLDIAVAVEGLQSRGREGVEAANRATSFFCFPISCLPFAVLRDQPSWGMKDSREGRRGTVRRGRVEEG